MSTNALCTTLCLGFASKLKVAVKFASQHSVYHHCINAIELTSVQTVILSIFHCLLNDDVTTFHSLLSIVPYLPQLQSSFIAVWLRDDYRFRQEDVAKVLSTLAILIKERNVIVPLPVIKVFTGLEEKYDVFTFFRQTGETTAQEMLACLNPLVTRATQFVPQGFKNQAIEATVSTETISTQTECQLKEKEEASFRDVDTRNSDSDRNPIPSTSNAHPVVTDTGNSAQSLIEEYLDSERMEESINIADIEGNLPIHRAAMDGRTDVVAALLQQGAKPNDTNSFKMTPLQMAITSCRTETIIFLLSNGASLQSRDIRGMTPLHHAAHYGDPEVLRLLLSYHVNKEAKDALGNRPLHFASKFGHTEAVRLLISAGANRQVRDCEGLRPIDWALHHGDSEMFRILRERGLRFR